MEIFMNRLSYSYNHTQITHHLAHYLHRPEFLDDPTAPFNFHVQLHRDKIGTGRLHAGHGRLTLPTEELGWRFLQIYGPGGTRVISMGGMIISFERSRGQVKQDILANIRLLPFRDPRLAEEEEQRSGELSSTQIPIGTIQFGWDCRDGVVSIEAEDSPRVCILCFDEDRRQFRIKFVPSTASTNQEYIIAIRTSSIQSMSVHTYLYRENVLLFFLSDPPTYETVPTSVSLEQAMSALSTQPNSNSRPLRRQLTFLPIPNHERVAPFASLVVRLVFQSADGVRQFNELRNLANFHRGATYEYPIARRGLFSREAIEEFERWTRKLRWEVSYQVESIVRDLSVDIKEMLDILPDIDQLAKAKGKEYAAAMLKTFGRKVKTLYRSEEHEDNAPDSVRECFELTLEEFSKAHTTPTLEPTDGSLYQAQHVTITPTKILLEGPFPERSNRVIRAYEPRHQESFLRVTFADEGRLQYRSNDRELDHEAFVRERFGEFLLNGLTIAKRHFRFLAYSQSALKEHSVWFVKPFVDTKHGLVNAESIIHSLGNFDGLDFDSQLMHCPARYAARLSQAFTATDACIIEVEEIINGRDIEVVSPEGQKYCFTDGVGTLSPELAREIWKHLKRTKRRARSVKGHPAAYQVRFMGSKGMLSVDYRLQGSTIYLRPSMIKFEAPNSRAIEIARSFDRPTPYFLNRPLITLLEGLGVPLSTFKFFQDRAVRETQQAASSLATAAAMLDTYGLGASFRLPSVMNSLNKLGIPVLNQDRFLSRAMEYAINHILRLLKNHARIPVPGAWTLVGVADVHRFLQPRQIFAYVKPLNSRGIYLEGPVLISRSPTIHPGDVQLVQAIGHPPPDSPFAHEPLANTVVFSVLGDRPLPSCLGGGDLDGDIYNLIPLEDPQRPELRGFTPVRPLQAPSQYAPAQRKILDRKATMRDVAEFVMEYILSDVLGIIAINWLIIADQSPRGIYDSDCLKLADLHSDAVDYPKTGNPVALTNIPRLKYRTKPDWNAPETVDTSASGNYYTSSKAIGKLFRAIELPVEMESTQGGTRVQSHRSRRRQGRNANTHSSAIPMLSREPYFSIIERRVGEFIATEEPFRTGIDEETEGIYAKFTSELEGICWSHTLSTARDACLKEEEALIGTITQKTSQPRKRKDLIARLREKTDILVRGTREALEGSESDTEEDYLQRAWFAWLLSLDKGLEFGARSFGWVTLGAVFDAIRQIEEREDRERLRLYN
ncbi:RNA-directed RNA polymerase 2 [Coprinopsis cinerea okayama7|uniref:RNA-dependent RNA polymerase n=1 Tax=Coprinopsis cinerea (strain Okayama-7 / 130 / ATCC MYA-4618 / FGSC 9003) TaxID=240176 RepID=A8N1X5_COPC7|nr:RNA-directed RNA polymerase 2 [Coprinopsis cinerea okayama7\|eukprot:XP_001828874.1 RNA-directed RNA polymerase 2 [Coprinopsis cinerea okayama7\